MSDIFLTDAELTALTGYARRTGQIAWLRAKLWRFEVDRDGNPRVARGYFDRRMGSDDAGGVAHTHNWGALGVGL